jgi:hypothetical protein
VVLRTALGGAGAALLSDVSVARAATVLVEVLPDPRESVRALLAGLDVFRLAQPEGRLAPVLARAWSEPRSADAALAAFAAQPPVADAAKVAELGFGPKLWFTLNGVPVTWRPLFADPPIPPAPAAPACRGAAPSGGPDHQLAASIALRGCGMSAAEAGRVLVGDLGRLAPGARFVPDLHAEPLAVRFAPDQGSGLRLAFLSHPGRIAVLALLLGRYGPDAGCCVPHAPVLTAGCG